MRLLVTSIDNIYFHVLKLQVMDLLLNIISLINHGPKIYIKIIVKVAKLKHKNSNLIMNLMNTQIKMIKEKNVSKIVT